MFLPSISNHSIINLLRIFRIRMFFFIKVVQLDATVAVVVSELLVKVFDRLISIWWTLMYTRRHAIQMCMDNVSTWMEISKFCVYLTLYRDLWFLPCDNTIFLPILLQVTRCLPSVAMVFILNAFRKIDPRVISFSTWQSKHVNVAISCKTERRSVSPAKKARWSTGCR